MKNSMKMFYRGSAAAAVTLFSAGAFAGPGGVGSLRYGTSEVVPTLGGTALIALALLLAVVAFRVLKSEQYKGVNLVIAVTAVTALAAATGGVKLISDATADYGIYLKSESGGTVQLNPGDNQIINGTRTPQSVLAIEIAPFCYIGGPNGGDNGGVPVRALNGGMNGGESVGECSDSPSTLIPADGGSCYLYINCDET